MQNRNLSHRIAEALTDTPVVFLTGGRQTGKSTLAQSLIGDGQQVTLDSSAVLAAARHDPEDFLAGFAGLTLIDEVQRAPELFLAIKRVVDQDRRPGRFLLTGSANPLLIPQVADSLAGRMEILTLYGFTQGELVGHQDGFVDRVFSNEPLGGAAGPVAELAGRLCLGGFPEVVLGRSKAQRRSAWFQSYINSFVQRDLRDLANIAGALEIPNMLKLLATRASQPLNLADLARQLSIQPTTFRRYLALLEVTYFVTQLPAWTVNLGKRVTKAPKLLVHDSGLLCHLLGIAPAKFAFEAVVGGQILENFVANELLRQLGWSTELAHLYHFRAHSGEEVDLVLESADGRVVGLEVKASHGLGASDWKGLKFMRDALGERFHRGIVLYGGSQALPLGQKLQAFPLSALWTT